MADNIVRQNSDIPWADFRDIEYGGGTLEVLRVDGNTFVAVPSMVRRELLSSSQTAARDLNRIMGEGFQSSIQKVRTTRNPKAINAIALKEFRKVIRALDKKGVPAASALLDALLDVALETVTDAAFGLDTKAQEVLAKLPEYFEQAQVAQRCMESPDDVVRHLAEFITDNPNFTVDDYWLP